MRNIWHKNIWRTGAIQIHVETSPTLLIKIKLGLKTDGYDTKIKMRRKFTQKISDMHKSKMASFESGKPVEFLLFVHKIKVSIETSGMLASNSNTYYLHTILHCKVIHEFETLCFQIGSMTMTQLNQVILGLVTYFLFQNIVQNKVHNTTWNEEDALIKSEALCWSYGLY